MDGSRDATAQTDEGAGIALGHGDDGRLAQQAAEAHFLAHALAGHGDDAHGRGLVVDHADGHFVGDEAGNGAGRSIHDEKDLITDLKYFVKDIVERRRILKYILIDELKTSIANLLQVKPSSLIDIKRETYAVIDKMICIFYLKFHADRIVQKQEGRNPYWIIERDDDTLYKSLKECMPYNLETYERVNEIFKKYLRFY